MSKLFTLNEWKYNIYVNKKGVTLGISITSVLWQLRTQRNIRDFMKSFEFILRLVDINNYLDVCRGSLGFREGIIARACVFIK